MHPTLMSMFADERALNLQNVATARRRVRAARGETRRLFSLRLPRRAARVAHA